MWRGDEQLIHGFKGTRFYEIWCGMKKRCYNKNSPAYSIYGAQGIKVCNRWLNFIYFRDDMYKSYSDHVKKFGEKNTQLDRINNFDGYYFENCRWATITEQANNKSNNIIFTFEGKSQPLSHWAEDFNINVETLRKRYKRGWNIKDALLRPLRTSYRKRSVI